MQNGVRLPQSLTLAMDETGAGWMTVRLGSYFPGGKRSSLSSEDEEIVRRFHDLYYRSWSADGADTINLSWFGYHLLKCPLDLWLYQELMVRMRPDVVVETGTFCGGSALYMAMIFDLIGQGRVITIDIEPNLNRPPHPRITYITGSSVDPAIISTVKDIVGSQRALVVLDSDHRAPHVRAELAVYSAFVHLGDYLIVEDTNVNGHPAFPEFGPGPMEAVEEFLACNDEFVVDRRCERFLMTLNPMGYLKRTKPRKSSL